MLANAYRRELESRGSSVEVAGDGATGLRRLDEFKPDLVQVDLMLPKLNGVEVIKAVRGRRDLSGVPILVVTTGYVADMMSEAWRAGATKVVSKLHYSPRAVADLVADLLRNAVRESAPPPATSVVPEKVRPLRSAVEPVPAEDAGLDVAATQADIRRRLVERAPSLESELRRALEAVGKVSVPAVRLAQLESLVRGVHSLIGPTTMAGFYPVAQLAGAFEALLRELYQKPRHVTASSLSTISQAIDCLGGLLRQEPQRLVEPPRAPLILAVDDEPISRHTLTAALGKAGLKSLGLDDPEMALRVCGLNRFDLILLDIDMPGMDGFELCRRLRALPTNQTTPVVFVTGLAGFDTLARSTLSGGQDLIAKPFLLIELTVKALTLILASRGR